MSQARDAASGAAFTLLGQACKFLIQLTSVAVLARLLLPGDFGTLSMVLALVGFANVLGDFGLSMAAIQAKSLSRGQRSNLFWLNVALGLVLSGAIFGLSWPIAAFYGRPELVSVVQALSGLFLLNAAAAQFRAEITRRLRFKWLSLVDVTAQASAFGVAFFFAAEGAGYWALVAQQITAAVVPFVLLAIGARWIPGLPTRREPMRSLVGFGANTTAVQLIGYASANIDSVLLGRVWGSTVLGFYDRAYQIFRLPLEQLAAPMTRVALPILSKIDDPPTYDRYVQRAQLVLTYAVGGALLTAAALSDPLIDILLGPKWDASKGLFSVLAIGGVFQAMGYVYYWIFLSKALTGLQLRYTLVTRILLIASIAIGVTGGAYGVAIGTAVGLFINWLVLTIWAVPKTGVDVPALVRIAARPVSMFGVMVGLVLPTSYWIADRLGPFAKLGVLVGVIAVFLSIWVAALPAARRDVSDLVTTLKLVRRRR